MFNVLVIVALSAAVAAKSGASGKIDHRVVARDVSFYTCSIFLLVASANDGEISWWEVSSRSFLAPAVAFIACVTGDVHAGKDARMHARLSNSKKRGYTTSGCHDNRTTIV